MDRRKHNSTSPEPGPELGPEPGPERGLFAWLDRIPLRMRVALTLGLIYLVTEGLGLRELTSVLSGTAVPGWDFTLALPLAAFYVLGRFAFLTVTPVLLLSTLFTHGLPALRKARRWRARLLTQARLDPQLGQELAQGPKSTLNLR